MLADEVIPQLGRAMLAVSKNVESAANEDRLDDARSWAEINHLNSQAIAQVLAQTIPLVQSTQQSLVEMAESESLRLQMAKDREQKLMATLSNLMKKMSESSESIVQNLK